MVRREHVGECVWPSSLASIYGSGEPRSSRFPQRRIQNYVCAKSDRTREQQSAERRSSALVWLIPWNFLRKSPLSGSSAVTTFLMKHRTASTFPQLIFHEHKHAGFSFSLALCQIQREISSGRPDGGPTSSAGAPHSASTWLRPWTDADRSVDTTYSAASTTFRWAVKLHQPRVCRTCGRSNKFIQCRYACLGITNINIFEFTSLPLADRNGKQK